MKSKISDFVNFLQTGVWRIRAGKLSGMQSFGLRQLRIILLAIRGFAEDKCQLRASALTYYSLLSIVPVLAMAFGVAKGFGFEKLLEKKILENMQGQEEIVTRVIEFSNVMLQNTQGGVIAGIGIVLLFWTVIKVLGNIEESFNEIWGIKKERPFGRKFSDYLSIMLICPVLLIMSSSVTVVITSQVKFLMAKLSFLGPIVPLIMNILQFLPFAVLWVLFTFIYIFMPNTNVHFKSGLLAGIIAGTIYQALQWVYINFQIGVSSYGAIYGSFAALPLFLVWLQISWLIVLFGAEISFAEQNVETYEFEPDCLQASYSFKKLTALRVAQLTVKNFVEGKKPLSSAEIAHQMEAPIRLVRQVVFDLTEAGILCEVKLGDNLTAYQPARDIEHLTIIDVVKHLEDKGLHDIPLDEPAEFKKLKEAMAAFENKTRQLPENFLLKEI